MLKIPKNEKLFTLLGFSPIFVKKIKFDAKQKDNNAELFRYLQSLLDKAPQICSWVHYPKEIYTDTVALNEDVGYLLSAKDH